MANLKVSTSVERKLNDIIKRMGGGFVQVGFMEGATYPDGTPVAAVAFWNEFGTVTSPPRPFFRNMIAAESPSWPGKMAYLAKRYDYDGDRVLGIMGADIDGALKNSINNGTYAPLAASTVDRKEFDKPLIDTSHMINSTAYQVKRGDVMNYDQATQKYKAVTYTVKT